MKKILLSALLVFTSVITAMASFTVTANSITTCNGSCGTLTATAIGGTAPYTFSWSLGGQTAMSINTCPTSTTTYTVIATDNTGATATAISVATINPNSVPTISGSTTICAGQSTTLTANGGGTYLWSTGQTTSSITVSPASTASYTVTTANAVGCTGLATVKVTIPPLPTPTITGQNTVCPGSSTTLTASGGGLYTWNTGATTTSITVSPASSTTYTVVGTIGGCSGSETFAVSVLPSLTGVIVTDSVYKTSCLGTGDGAIDLTLSGSNPGPFTYQWSNGMTTEDITNVTSGYYSVTIFDAAMNCWGNNYQVLADGINCGTLSGNVFDDKNLSCTNDTGDDSLPSIIITANPGNYKAITNNQGSYVFNTMPYGSYTLTQQTNSTYILPTCATTLNATLNAGNKNITNLDFADTIASIPKDVSVNAYSTGIVPGFSCSVNFYLDNLSGNPASGTLCITLPTGYGALVTSGTTGYSVNADTVCWSYSNISSYSNYYGVSFTVPVNTPLGSIFKACGKATVIGTDVNPSNNYYCYERIVTGSFDPNDKSVNPIGQTAQGNITLNDKTFYYHINFQNTGNGPAVNIVVKDTLSDKLDIATLDLVRSSHNYILDIMPGNVLRWKFNNIMLADSVSNEPASHGWIAYKIKQKTSNQIGDQIKNTAHIYFDFNEAVVTNTTVNTITAPNNIDEKVSSDNSIKVYPNPFTDNTTFVIQSDKLNEVYSFELVDVLGKQVKSIEEINSKEFQISRTGLPNGIYFYKLNTGKSLVHIGKLVIK